MRLLDEVEIRFVPDDPPKSARKLGSLSAEGNTSEVDIPLRRERRMPRPLLKRGWFSTAPVASTRYASAGGRRPDGRLRRFKRSRAARRHVDVVADIDPDEDADA